MLTPGGRGVHESRNQRHAFRCAPPPDAHQPNVPPLIDMAPQQPFPKLVELARTGDAGAITALMSMYRPIVVAETHRFIDALTGDVSIQDLEQEVWIKVWRHLPKFRGSDEEAASEMMFTSWIRTTTRHVALSVIQKRQALKRGGETHTRSVDQDRLPGDDETPSSIVRVAESKERVNEAMGRLDDPQTAEIVRMRFFEEFSVAEISGRTGLSTDQVRYRLNTALRILATYLDGENTPPPGPAR